MRGAEGGKIQPMKRRHFIAGLVAAMPLVLAHSQSESELNVAYKATGGTFTLKENGRTTDPIPFDASLEQVNVALERAQIKTRFDKR